MYKEILGNKSKLILAGLLLCSSTNTVQSSHGWDCYAFCKEEAEEVHERCKDLEEPAAQEFCHDLNQAFLEQCNKRCDRRDPTLNPSQKSDDKDETDTDEGKSKLGRTSPTPVGKD